MLFNDLLGIVLEGDNRTCLIQETPPASQYGDFHGTAIFSASRIFDLSTFQLTGNEGWV
ncbi:hypothetical protein QG37_06823 [Candidozyma auris]|uniref:Uncharacterized protein n=1 Tax=Candidozyma auris TaxID=498019 RepID=A0A0L0NRE3_CANAR|nr:hypothetical protein QG37_06823 [[Candida] auris]